MGIISWIVLGLIAGLLGKAVMPGRDPGGFFLTVILGIAGAFVGGWIGTSMGIASFDGFTLQGILVAAAGSIVLLALYRFLKRS
jgi:uncharacterized membrane protein YeaQ/YmgE (transglycosylase-associated protein family)